MGWLGWSEQQTLDADVNAIALAYAGKCEMLQQIFGSPDDEPIAVPEQKLQPLTPSLFKFMMDKDG